MSAGFGVNHGGNMFLRHQVSEELLTALRLLPDEHEHTEHVWLFHLDDTCFSKILLLFF